MKSAGHGFLAMVDAMGAQATEQTRSKVCEYLLDYLLSAESLTLVFTYTVA